MINSTQIQMALSDICRGWYARALWSTMAMHDIRQRYRRSVLGPFWITISMGVMVAALGLLYGKIFRLSLQDYMPYLSSGFVVWGLISGIVVDGTRTFTSSENLIRQLSAPLSIYAYRSVWLNLVTFAHHIWIFALVAIWFEVVPGWGALWCVPGIVFLAINGLWVGLLLGLLSARFRDIPLMVASVMQVLFFLTPVIWRADMLPERVILLDLNPFYHIMETVRAPLLGGSATVENWLVVLLITFTGWAVTLVVFSMYRWRIAYWV